MVQPYDILVNLTFSPSISVALYDALGVLIFTDSQSVVTLTVNASDAETDPPTPTVTAVNGVARFSGLVFRRDSGLAVR